MTTFYEGQDVEVAESFDSTHAVWRQAKIITAIGGWKLGIEPPQYGVEFPDGTSGVFDAAQIRAIVSDAEVEAYIKRVGDQDKEDCIE